MAKDSPPSRKLASAKQDSVAEAPKPRASSASRQHEAPEDKLHALESAQYIAQMSAELAAIARASNLELLAYFLEMARVEASSSVRKLEDRYEEITLAGRGGDPR
jgi:hypothetical protein